MVAEHSGGLVARHVRSIPRSGIRDFFEIVQSMRDVISLGIGEPDFVTPWRIREAAIYALEQGRTGYTSNLGLPRLRRSISNYVGHWFGIEYRPEDEILVTVGVSEALDIALRAVINPGDEILFHEPCYVSYAPGITLSHGKPVPVSTSASDGFALRADAIAARLTPASRALVLNFPTNPTGAVLDRAELERIARLCVKHDLVVISDEVYAELTFPGHEHVSIASLPGMRERTIFLHGCSKAFAMTGFRLGFACAPAELTEAMMRVHQYAMLCASIIAQEAAIEALDNCHEEMLRMREKYMERRNFVVAAFRRMGLPCVEPKGTFYAFPDISATGLSSREFAVRLLEEERVAMVPGDAFGPCGAGFVRCSCSTAMELIEIAMDRIARFVERLRATSPAQR